MLDVPTCGAVAEYRGCRLKIQFGGDDWIAVRPPSGLRIPDALGKIDSGRADLGQLVKRLVSEPAVLQKLLTAHIDYTVIDVATGEVL